MSQLIVPIASITSTTSYSAVVPRISVSPSSAQEPTDPCCLTDQYEEDHHTLPPRSGTNATAASSDGLLHRPSESGNATRSSGVIPTVVGRIRRLSSPHRRSRSRSAERSNEQRRTWLLASTDTHLVRNDKGGVTDYSQQTWRDVTQIPEIMGEIRDPDQCTSEFAAVGTKEQMQRSQFFGAPEDMYRSRYSDVLEKQAPEDDKPVIINVPHTRTATTKRGQKRCEPSVRYSKSFFSRSSPSDPPKLIWPSKPPDSQRSTWLLTSTATAHNGIGEEKRKRNRDRLGTEYQPDLLFREFFVMPKTAVAKFGLRGPKTRSRIAGKSTALRRMDIVRASANMMICLGPRLS
ncbi:hypothetical protein IAT40_005518 [Kwoniella sp. CBS 6097]